MRLIGNKTKLLPEIERVLKREGIRSGTLLDVFAGTSSVGRHFKSQGFQVVSNDNMSLCYAQAVAGVEQSEYPSFAKLRSEHSDAFNTESFRHSLITALGESGLKPKAAELPLIEAIHFLNTATESRVGLVTRCFSPQGAEGRRYFTETNAMRIDGVLEFLKMSRSDSVISRGEFYLLLASLVDAADRVANISGTYGAYLKGWQSNSQRDLSLRAPTILPSELKHRAYRGDANDIVRDVACDVLYIDPPYNRRQYPANYHVLEILAEFHRLDDPKAFEETLYGKTGLRPYEDLKSDFCVPVGRRREGRRDVFQAMHDLILSSKAKHVVISYNEEGLLSREQIGEILAEFSGQDYNYRKNFKEILYKRFRSDSDHQADSGRASRHYRVVDGRKRDEIAEWLFFASASPERVAGLAGNVDSGETPTTS
ncbi:MAG: DNA adenine methylase [Planctomycetota bacterium]